MFVDWIYVVCGWLLVLDFDDVVYVCVSVLCIDVVVDGLWVDFVMLCVVCVLVVLE